MCASNLKRLVSCLKYGPILFVLAILSEPVQFTPMSVLMGHLFEIHFRLVLKSPCCGLTESQHSRSQTLSFDLNNMSLKELKKLEHDIANAVITFDTRIKAVAIAELEAHARQLGFSLAELTGGAVSVKRGRAAAVKKYRNPANPSDTWSGRGRQPRWFAAALLPVLMLAPCWCELIRAGWNAAATHRSNSQRKHSVLRLIPLRWGHTCQTLTLHRFGCHTTASVPFSLQRSPADVHRVSQNVSASLIGSAEESV